MNVYEKLQHVQEALKAPKNQYNKFGDYHYRNCEDIQKAAKPLLKEVKAALVVGDELVLIGDRYYIKATARFIDCESTDKVENTAYARESLDKKGMDASQVTGSTSSYARKYALNGLFCIDDVKDADNQDNTDKKSAGGQKQNPKSGKKPAAGPAAPSGLDSEGEKAAAEKIDQAKLEVIRKELERTGLEDNVVLKLFKVRELEEITNGQFITVMKKFKATPSKEA